MRLSTIPSAICAILSGARSRNRWRDELARQFHHRHQASDTEASNAHCSDIPQQPAGPELPLEVWENCWQGGLLSPDDLKSLSATSHYFRAVCEPDIYREIYLTLEEFLATHLQTATRSFSPRLTPDAFLRRMHQMIEKLQSLAQSEKHRSLVKVFHFQTIPTMGHLLRFRFSFDKTIEIKRVRDIQVKQLFEYLPSFQNIRTLSLSLIEVDHIALTAISKLSSLDALIINEAFFVCKQYTPRLALESLDLSPGTTHSPVFEFPDIFSASRLRSLKFQSVCLEGDNNILRLMGALEPRGFAHLSNLDLSLQISDMPILESFLSENAINLQTLRIEFDLTLPMIFPFSLLIHNTEDIHSFHIPPTAIPFLRSFSGPLLMAKSILPGRPVQSIEIKDYFPDQNMRRWQDLLQHIVPICEEVTCDILDLTLSFNLNVQHGLFEMIAEHFPKLHSLELSLVSEKGRLPADDFPNHVFTPCDGAPSSDPRTFLGILEGLVAGTVPLPRSIKRLSLLYKTFCMRLHNLLDPNDPPCRPPRFWSTENQNTYLRSLSAIYPTLQSMAFGMDNQPLFGSSLYEPFKWNRSGDCDWKLGAQEKIR